MMGIFKRFWSALTGADRPETLYDFPSYPVDPVTDKVVEEDQVLATMGSEIAKAAEPAFNKADVEKAQRFTKGQKVWGKNTTTLYNVLGTKDGLVFAQYKLAADSKPLNVWLSPDDLTLDGPQRAATGETAKKALAVQPLLELKKGQKVYVKGYGMQHTVFSMSPSGNVNLRYRSSNYWYNRSGVPLSKILLEKPVKK